MINVKCTFCNKCLRIVDVAVDDISAHIHGFNDIEAKYFLKGIEWYLDLTDAEHVVKFVSEPCNEMCNDKNHSNNI